METTVNGFGGLNQDMGYDSIPNNLYIDAKDIRITTTDGESQGSFTNLQGHEQGFIIPQDDYGTPNGLKEIIGVATIRNKFVIFVTDDSNTNGWIYQVVYDEDRNIASTSPSIVYWNANLLFRKQWPIEALGRYESDCVQRVYWTDYNNYFRSLNITDPQLATFDDGLVDVFPDVEWTQPIIKAIPSGGNIFTGIYQASFKLLTSDGKETLISPPSVTLHIVSDSEGIPSLQYNGDPLGSATNKSILVSIDTTNYQEFYKIILIISYSDTLLGTPQIFEVESMEIGTQTSVEFLFTGEESSTIVDINDYTSRVYPFKTFKTMTQKDNSLVVANIKQQRFSIQDLLEVDETFDPLASRYNSSGDLPSIVDYTDNEIKFNVPYNKDAHWDTNWHLNEQFKYQQDGITLGGEGVNVSYTFTLEPMIADDNASPSIANVSSTGSTIDLEDSYTYFNNSYPSLASPQLSGLIRGFKRGETYRIGLVGYNDKGEASFVEFIGDIKFPDISEHDNLNNESGTDYFPLSKEDGDNTIAYNLGLEFNIDFSTAPSLLTKLKSYQIVRVKRENTDKRRITTGIYKTFSKLPVGTATGNYDFASPSGGDNILHLSTTPSGVLNEGNFTMLPTQTYNGYQLYGDYFAFYSPEIMFDFNNFKQYLGAVNNGYMLITGSYKDYSSSNPRYTVNAEGVQYDTTGLEDLGIVWDIRKKLPTTLPIDRYTPLAPYTGEDRGVEYIKKIDDRGFALFNNDRLAPNIDFTTIVGPFTGGAGSLYMRNYYANVDSADDLNNPNGASDSFIYKGASGLLGRLNSVSIDPLTGLTLPVFSNQVYFNGGTQVIPDGTTSIDGLPIMDIIVPKSEIYNGYSQEALESNIFIPCSPVLPISETTFRCFGGDTFLNLWTFQEATTWVDRDFYQQASSANRYNRNVTKTINIIIESSINIELNYGSTLKTGVRYSVLGGPSGQEHTRWRQETRNSSTDYGKALEMYKYNNVYSKESNTVNYFIDPRRDFGICFTNDIRALLSNVKTNEEIVDSWTKFGVLNFWDIDDYGPINKILNWKNYVYFFQDKALGVYSINPRALVATSDGIQTELGTAQGIVKHQYISETNGSIHQWAIKATDTAIYYFDAISKKLWTFQGGNNPLSEIKGLHSLIQLLPKGCFVRKENGGDNPIMLTGVHIGKDNINDEVLFTFLSSGFFLLLRPETKYDKGQIVFYAGIYYEVIQSFVSTTEEDMVEELELNSIEYFTNKPLDTTLVYDELMQQFSSSYSAAPKIYLENSNILLSPDPLNSEIVYIHNKGDYGRIYGEIQESFIKFVVNPNADINKVLRFIEFNSIVRDTNKVIDRTTTITAFRIQTEYQDSGKIDFSPLRFKRKFSKWRLKIPRDILTASQRGRFRSTYFIVTLYYDNESNKELIANRVLSYYDIQIF